MEKMQPLRSASQVRGLLEMIFAQLDQMGDSVKTRAGNWLAEKQRSFSGSAYLDQIEKNAVYLAERARAVNAISAHYLCAGEPVLPADAVELFVSRAGVDQARRAARLHLVYVRSGGCPGCEVHADHHRYSTWRDLRQLGDWPRYVEEMEFSYVYFQGLLITANTFLHCLLTNPQFAGIAQWVPPAEVLQVVEERVQFRSNLWLGNVQLEIPGLEQQSGQGKTGLASTEEHCNRGLAYQQQGRLDDAIHEYQAALRIDPNDGYAHYSLGAVYGQQGRLDEAVREFQAALRIRPNAGAHYGLGMVFGQQGRLDDAVYHYQAALRIKPDHADAHYNLGVTYMQQRRSKEAVVEGIRELQIAAQLGSQPAREWLAQMGLA